MNYCPNCRNKIENPNKRFCPYCGAQQSVNTNQGNGYEGNVGQNMSQNQGYGMDMGQNQSNIPGATFKQERPMKWYKFLIYFALFAGALVNFSSGFSTITGQVYSIESGGTISADDVYAVFDGLQTLDMIYGLVGIAMAVYAIFVRFALAGFKKYAPNMIVAYYAIGTVSSFLYNLIGSNIIKEGTNGLIDVSDSGIGISLAIGALMTSLNSAYFAKRKDMFQN